MARCGFIIVGAVSPDPIRTKRRGSPVISSPGRR
jgi:hypothetical protein